ncbi:MAG: putative peptidoglycan glycosyltransferase FtsW, partial [Candidatus Cybelea sp.]
MHNAAAVRANRGAERKTGLRSYVAAPLDVWLFTSVAALVAIGLVMVFSASSATAYAEHGDVAYYLKRQLIWLVVALGGAYLCYRIDYQRLRRAAPYLLVAAMVALVLVFVPHVGLGVNGGRRWIGTAGLSFEPSEFSKLALVIYLSAVLSSRGERITSLGRGLFPLFVPVAIMGVLVLKEPDMGTASLLFFTAFALLFAAGARVIHLAAIALTTVPFAVLTVLASPYRRARVFAFVDPWKDPLNTGFHIVQSLLALGSGGIFGVGLGASRAKFFYLPEQYTDFIFSVLGEELGLIGTLVVVALFVTLAYRTIKIALAAPDRFGFFL